MDSPTLPNLTPATITPATTGAAATTPTAAPTLDFAALLALELPPTTPDNPALAPAWAAADAEDTVIAAAESVPSDLGALLRPEQLTAIQQLAAQPQWPPAVPHPVAVSVTASVTVSVVDTTSDDNRATTPLIAPEQAAKPATRGEWLPLPPADAVTTPGSTAGIPLATISSSPAPLPAIALPAAPAIPRIDVPLSQPGWSEAFSSRVVWLAGQHQPSAELHVHPPELGPIDIVLSLDRNQAHVHFSSAHLSVREAIEAALPALHEALSQAGIQLGEASVSAENPRHPGPALDRGVTRHPRHEDDRAIASDRAAVTHRGLVDTFA